jgi:methanogenic corrinoid protein MtbC1
MLSGRGIPVRDLSDNLIYLDEAVRALLDPRESAVVARYVAAGVRCLERTVNFDSPFVDAAADPENPALVYIDALLQGKRDAASKLVRDTVDAGSSIREIYLNIFQPAQHEIGRLWQLNRITVAQEHYCTAATQLIMSQLYPLLFAGEKTKGNVVATCVGGDLHELGVRMVADFLELDGWNTFYLGASTPSASVVHAISDRQAALVAISATMTFHVRTTESLIALIRADPYAKSARVLVGGYPFNRMPDLWQRVGADGYARDAQAAVSIANQLMET